MDACYTIGHSTRTISDFISLLKEHNIDILIDVRKHPGSRRHPQFNKGNLDDSLRNVDIDYQHMETLGGRRGKPSRNSPNTGWESPGFQAYADYLNTQLGQEAIEELLALTQANTPAIMCAEAVFWRCHRQLIADALVARGIEVIHILDEGQTQTHQLNDMAQLRDDGQIIYPDPSAQQELFDN